MFKYIEEQAVEHAKKEFPLESVGVVCGGNYIPLTNAHTDPSRDFYVTEEDYLAVQREHGSIEAVVHSHPYIQGEDPHLYPSANDMRGQMSSGVPWGIVCCDHERAWPVVWWGDSLPIPPLVGRGFIHGVTDCYSLIRDYYRLELGINLKEFPRDWGWWNNEADDLYSVGFSCTGFRQIGIEQVKPGDVFLATVGHRALRAGKTNHGGIVLDDGVILHHCCGDSGYDVNHRLSVKECGFRYLKYVTHYLRHEKR